MSVVGRHLPDCPRNIDRQQCSGERTLIFPIRSSANGTLPSVTKVSYLASSFQPRLSLHGRFLPLMQLQLPAILRPLSIRQQPATYQVLILRTRVASTNTVRPTTSHPLPACGCVPQNFPFARSTVLTNAILLSAWKDAPGHTAAHPEA